MKRFGFLVGVFALVSMGCIVYPVADQGVEIHEVQTEPQIEAKPEIPRDNHPVEALPKAEPAPSVASTKAESKAAPVKAAAAPKPVMAKKRTTIPRGIAPSHQKQYQSSSVPCTKNRVVVTCPTDLSYLVVERFDGSATSRFVVKPGTGMAIYAQTPCSDCPLAFVVHGYRTTTDGKDVYVGRVFGRFRNFEFLLYGHTIFWNVSPKEFSK